MRGAEVSSVHGTIVLSPGHLVAVYGERYEDHQQQQTACDQCVPDAVVDAPADDQAGEGHDHQPRDGHDQIRAEVAALNDADRREHTASFLDEIQADVMNRP